MTNIKILGIDIAKNVFQLYGASGHGKKLLNKRLTRDKLVTFIGAITAGITHPNGSMCGPLI